jgi:glycerol-3-phosphate acyltransferase PlsX
MLDVGANVDVDGKMLAQFALMGELYSKLIFHTENPRVGLLSIGEEEHKGNELTKAATPLLKELPINFIGNVEGRDLFTGHADVIVCDGFVGNVALKVSEGLVEVGKHLMSDALKASVSGKLGYLLARGAAAWGEGLHDYLPRAVECECDSECDPGGGGVCAVGSEPAFGAWVGSFARGVIARG